MHGILRNLKQPTERSFRDIQGGETNNSQYFTNVQDFRHIKQLGTKIALFSSGEKNI